MKPEKLALLGAVMILALSAGGCNKLRARDQLNKGVASWRNAQFQQAIMYFKTAVDLDPTLLNARLYLATAYAQQYIPGGESEDNVKIAKQAIEAFEDVLQSDPTNLTAISSIALLYYHMAEFEKAKEYQRRRLQVTPNDPEPYYWIGVIDWAICYPRRMEVRKDLNIAYPPDPNKPGVLTPIPARARTELAEENGKLVEEGLDVLQKAIDLKPNDADAMAYLNLMYRERSDLQETAEAREADLKLADEWVDKALSVKKLAAASTAAEAFQ